MTFGLALYAALVATGGLGWQIYRGLRDHRTIVKVKLQNVIEDFGPFEGVLATITNYSYHQVRVVAIELEGTGKADGTRTQAHRELDKTIPALDSTTTGFQLEDLDLEDGLDIKSPVRARVTLSTGDTISSSELAHA